jgi:phage FluMu protein Com
MFDRFFEQDTHGVLKGLTLEWKCPTCKGLNFRLILIGQRNSGICHTQCRDCKAKYRVDYPVPDRAIEGEEEFLERLSDEDFTSEEELDMIKDFAEIAALKVDSAPLLIIKGKEKALEEKIVLAKRRRRL